jgi:ribosome-binding protein aMBF1 (putative translation factor)
VRLDRDNNTLKKTRPSAPNAKKKAPTDEPVEDKPKQPTNKPFAERFAKQPSPAAKALAANVRRRRLELGLSQAELAKAANTGQPMIGLIELGRNNPTLHMIESIAKALKTTAADLLSGSRRRRADAAEA